MNLNSINTEAEYQTSLQLIRELWEAEQATPEALELENLVKIVTEYEEVHFPIEEPDPIEYAKIRMEELGLQHYK